MTKIIKCFKRLSHTVLRLVYLVYPIKKNTVLFSGFTNQYGDNVKYISEYLHKKNPEVELAWVIFDRVPDDMPSYIKKVYHKSKEYYKYGCCAQVVVDNQVGIRGYRYQDGVFNRILAKLICHRRRGQYNISNWHGTPLKKIGINSLKFSKPITYSSNIDSFAVGCEYTKTCLESAFPLNVPINLYGTPRNDILFDKNIDIENLKNKLNLPLDCKIILFAPTYRMGVYKNDVNYSGVSQMHSINFEKLFAALEQKFGDKWCFVFRVHHIALSSIDTASIAQKYGGRVIDGNIGDDMAEYLVCTDALITDYSGSLFDYALTKRPCFLLTPDREYYENVECGLYMDFNTLPFPKSNTSDELIEQIESFDNDTYVEAVEQFLQDIGNVEDGHAAERIVDDILDFMKTGIKR